MSESVTAVEAPAGGFHRMDHEPGFFQKYGVAIIFLAPTLALLGVWVVYPTIRTIIRSFYDRDGDEFIGIDNYETLFTDDTLFTAIKNNFLWLLIVPVFVTAIGLLFAVLLERIRFSVAFKVVVFMPMAISLFAAGVIWRLMYEKDPSRGTVNAAVAVVKDAVSPSGVALRGTTVHRSSPGGALGEPRAGETARARRRGVSWASPAIRSSDVPEDAVQAVVPEALAGGITGVVWRDFKPGGGTPGQVEEDELGLPGVTVELRDDERPQRSRDARRSPTAPLPSEDVEPGSYRAAIGADTFSEPYAGVSWLGASLITPAIMMSYIWVWAGFSMVVIAAGLAAIPRDLLEAARTDGATEWQVFRRVTVPLLAPVLSVVFVTMLIYVLKVFDIVIAIAPGSVEDDANVIALAMWRTSFGGVNDFGLGAAIAVFLFLLVIPILALNIRRFRREV